MAKARRMLKSLNISCLKATEHHSRKMDGALGLLGNLTMKAHFVHCPPCAEAAAQMDLIRKAMRSVAVGGETHGDRLAPPPSGVDSP
jgi:hypothetical protein